MLSGELEVLRLVQILKISPEIRGVKLSNIRRVHEISLLQLKELNIGNKKNSANQ